MRQTKQERVNAIRRRLGITGYHRQNKPLNKNEYRKLARLFDADLDGSETNAELRAKIMNAAGLSSGSTAVDYEDGFKKFDVRRLETAVADAVIDE